MVLTNINRPLLKSNSRDYIHEKPNDYFFTDDDENIDPSWPHLKGIYEFFMELLKIEEITQKEMKFCLTRKFIFTVFSI